MSKTFLIAVILALLAGGVVYFQRDRLFSEVKVQEQESQISPQTQGEQESIVGGAEQEQPQAQPQRQEVIKYTNSGYSPSSLVVKKGATVTFKNESSRETWPASAKHPTHEVYPAAGGCIGSMFDTCRGLKTGETWSFVFNIPGTWKYHDHLNPQRFGAVVVE